MDKIYVKCLLDKEVFIQVATILTPYFGKTYFFLYICHVFIPLQTVFEHCPSVFLQTRWSNCPDLKSFQCMLFVKRTLTHFLIGLEVAV